jgi:hypothetical protein
MKENLLEKIVFMRVSKFLKECRYCELQKRRFSATGYFSVTGAGMLIQVEVTRGITITCGDDEAIWYDILMNNQLKI